MKQPTAHLSLTVLLPAVLALAACGTGSQPVGKPTAVPPAAAAPTVAPTARTAAAPTVAPTAPPKPTAPPNTPIPQPTVRPTGPKLDQVIVARGMNGTDPLEPATQFKFGATEFYVAGRILDPTNDMRVKVSWEPLDVQGYTGKTPIHDETQTIKGASKFWFHLHTNDNLPPGKYTANVSIGSATPQKVPFDILPGPWPTLAKPDGELPELASQAKPSAVKPTNLEFILDASGSMNEPVAGAPKMAAAHDAMHQLVTALATDDGVNVGLRAYSTNSAGAEKSKGCQDSDLLVPMKGVDKDQLNKRLDGINAVGDYTPMSYAVQQAANDFANVPNAQNAVVLVSDGKENCSTDPVNEIKAAAAKVKMAVHVVGFDVADDAEARTQLQAIASNTGGIYVDASTPDELALALKKVAAEQVKVIHVLNGPGQLKVDPVPGAEFFGWDIRDDADREIVDENGHPKDAYALPSGTYKVAIDPWVGGAGAVFQVEIAGGQRSTLHLGAMELTQRSEPFAIQIFDDNLNRLVGEGNHITAHPMLLPAGKYTIMTQQSVGAAWNVIQRGVEVQPNAIVQVEI